LAALNRDLTSAYDRTITSITTTLLASASTHHTFLSSALARLATELAAQHSAENAEISALKLQIASQSRGAREAEIDRARREGDVAGQQRARDELWKGHAEELMRVRREARMEGYEAGFRAGVERREAERREAKRRERRERLGSLFSEGESQGRNGEGYNPELEFGFQGHLGGAGGRQAASLGEQQGGDAGMEDAHLGAEELNFDPNFRFQAYLGGAGGIQHDFSGLKHAHDDDGELYNATPPRATKLPKFEHSNNRGIAEEAPGTAENRSVSHQAPPKEPAQSFSGRLFLSSDEEVDDGMRDAFHMDGEGSFDYF
ncbi:hypothetical protein V492_07399, partial [Pseudogymnoascus sp. VKM F-4246]